MHTEHTHASVQDEVSRVEFQVGQVVSQGFDEHTLNLAQEHLSELKAAAERLLAHGGPIFTSLVAARDDLWVSYRNHLKAALRFLKPLL